MTWKAGKLLLLSLVLIILIALICIIVFTIVIMIVIMMSLIELSVTESHSPVEQQRSIPPGGSPGAAHCQPGQPNLSPPWQPPQLESSPPGPHCHSCSPMSHRVYRKQWEKPIESNVQGPIHSYVVASQGLDAGGESLEPSAKDDTDKKHEA